MGLKLIRDKMDAIPWGNEAAKGNLREVANAKEFRDLLIQKLLEEVGELVTACYGDELLPIVTELADVQEVLRGLMRLHGIHREDVATCRVAKFMDRGGFNRGLVWET